MIDLSKFISVKCPATLIRQQFKNVVQSYGNLAMGVFGVYNAETTRAFSNTAEYNAGTTYIVKQRTGYNKGNNVFLFSGIQPTHIPLTQEELTFTDELAYSFDDTTHVTNLVGYLKYTTVQEYCAKRNITSAAQLFLSVTRSAPSPLDAGILTDESGNPINDLNVYANWIVPEIQWYYGDNNNRQSTNDPLQFWYLFNATGALWRRYDAGSTELDGAYTSKTEQFNAPPAYIAFSPPYYTNLYSSDTTGAGAFFSGVAYARWQDIAGGECYVHGHNIGYKVFFQNPPAQTNLFDITAISDTGHTQIGVKYSPVVFQGDSWYNTFVAYKSVDDIIKLFADYGIKLTTDPEEAEVPPPSEQGIINPDDPNVILPAFPDNETDETPIDPTYITPSTFGQSMVYNPLTTKRFLSWISDSTVNIDNWKRLFANPADVILGINIFNLDIPAHDPNRSQLSAITDILGVTTDIPNYSILDGYNNIISGGELYLQAYYGNYADFTSMTYQIYIPFVGFTSLRASDVVNKTLKLYYAVDFMTGSAIAFLNSDNKLIYTSPCTVCGKIPLTTSDKNSQAINNTLSILGGIGGLLAGVATGNIAGGIGSAVSGLSGIQMQTNYTNHGSMSGVNIFKLLPAFIERTRYDLFLPSGEQQYLGSKYQNWAGAPSTQFAALKDCVDDNGYIECDVVVLPNCTATEQEKTEIRSLIKSGIFI